MAQETAISLSGEHYFADYDEERFADPKYDDSAWSRINVPGSWQAQGVASTFDVGWYRIHFTVPDNWQTSEPAIQIGLIGRADEVFLNGRKIGGEGKVGLGGSLQHSYAPALPRLYPFATTLLNRDGDNVLAVRVARLPFVDEGGIVSGPVALVDYRGAFPTHSSIQQRYIGFSVFLFGVEMLIPIVALTAFLFGLRDRVVISFLAVSLMYLLLTLEDNHAFYLFGLSSDLSRELSLRMPSLIWIPLLEFVAAVCGRRVGLIGRTLQCVALLSAIGFSTGPNTIMTTWLYVSIPVALFVMLATLLLITWWTAVAVYKRQNGALPLLFGLVAITVFQVADIVLPTTGAETYLGRPIAVFGVFIFQVSLAVIIGLRLIDTERALKRANATALQAHAEERRRLARDIHDGVGQWLSVIKLNLQMLNSESQQKGRLEKGRVEELVEDVSHAIDDTRRIAHDLAPAFLEEHGLFAAIQSHCDRLRREGKVKIHVSGREPDGLDNTRRDHLYRLFQEALKNALEHSQCSRIDVALNQNNSGVTLDISDDGQGMSEGAETNKSTLGLASMKERASLIGGKLQTRRSESGGTSVRIDVPLNPR